MAAAGSETGEITELRARLAEAEAVLHAIRSGTADAFVDQTGGISHLNGSERPYVTFFDAMNEGGVTLDSDGNILHGNPCFVAMIGRPIESLRGASFLACMTSENRAHVAELLTRTVAAACEVSLDSSCGPLLVRLSLKTVDAFPQQFRCLVVTDLSERAKAEIELRAALVRQYEADIQLRQSEERMRAMYANLQSVVEVERKHVAREVHDELGQILTALRMETSMLQRELAGREKAQGRLDGMRSLIEEMFKTVRSIAGNLRPSTLDLGLVSAIEWLAEDFEKRWQIECALDIDPRDIPTSDAHATTVFRVIQESLNNVARHASASRVSIWLRQSLDHLQLEIRDNGCGFAYDAEQTGGFGLVGMQERVMEMGGTLTVQSSPGQGSAILIDLPWTPTEEK